MPDFPAETSWGIDDTQYFYSNFSFLEDLEEYSIPTVRSMEKTKNISYGFN